MLSQFPPHETKQKEIVIEWQQIKDLAVPIEKDLDPDIAAMQDITRNIKKKKNDICDKTTVDFVDSKMKPLG